MTHPLEAAAMAPAFRVIDGPHVGTVISASEAYASDCIRCGGLDAECGTCLGIGYVLGWDASDRPTGRLEPLRSAEAEAAA